MCHHDIIVYWWGKSDDGSRAVNETGRFSVSDDYQGCDYIILALLAFVESASITSGAKPETG